MAAKKEMKGTKNVYNAKGSPEMESAEDETPGFKKGGVAKKKRDHEKLKKGGKVEGEMAKMRADKKPRGHHAEGGHAKMEHHKRAAGGRTPYTSGHSTTSDVDNTNSGHEGARPPS